MAYLEKIYAEMGVKNDPTEEYFTTDSRHMLTEQTLRRLPAGNMCDLGCGRGLLIRQLKDHHTCYGTDFDAGAVQHCRSQGLSVEQIDLNTAAELPFPNVVFDVVVLSEVCEHLLDPGNAIRLAKRHLRTGGKLIVSVPNAVPLFARLKLLLGGTVSWLHYPSRDTEEIGHIRFYTIDSMTRLLRQEEMTVESVTGVSFRFNGRFWGRVCYWVPQLLGAGSAAAPARMDLRLGRMMPGFSPGIFFVCSKP